MGRIFESPKCIKVPDIREYLKRNEVHLGGEYFKAEEKFIEDVKKWAKDNYEQFCKEAGELISFPVGDGKALYVVAKLKPVTLIHLPLGDAYAYKYAQRLTAKDVKDEIQKGKSVSELFSKKEEVKA